MHHEKWTHTRHHNHCEWYLIPQSELPYPLHLSWHLYLSICPSIWSSLSFCDLSCHNNSIQCPSWILTCYMISLSHQIFPFIGISLCLSRHLNFYLHQYSSCRALQRAHVRPFTRVESLMVVQKIFQLFSKVTRENIALIESLNMIFHISIGWKLY